jgi:hypothetical protein
VNESGLRRSGPPRKGGRTLSAAILFLAAGGCLAYALAHRLLTTPVSRPDAGAALAVLLAASLVIARLASNLRAAKEALRQRTVFLAEGQRISQTGSLGWRPSTGELLWSEETFRIFNLDPATPPTVSLILDRVHPDDRERVRQTIEQAAGSGTNIDIEHRLLLADGAVKHLHVVAHLELSAADDPEFIGVVMDITAAKEAENKIRLIINTVPAQLWTAHPDGRYDFIGQGNLDFLGTTADKRTGQERGLYCHPDDAGRLRSGWRQAVAEGRPHEVEVRIRRHDGQYRWFLSRAQPLLDGSGKVLGWYGNDVDIHDRKQAEERLVESEAYLADAQRLSHTGSWAWAPGPNEIRYWSEESYRILAFDPKGPVPEFATFFQRIHPDDREKAAAGFATATRAKAEFALDYRIVRPSGEIRDIHAVGHPVLDSAGALVEFVGTVLDVTDRKRSEDALRRSRAYLAEAQKLSRTGSFALRLPGMELEFSDETTRILGFAPGREITLEEALARVHPEDVAAVRAQLDRAMRDDSAFEYENRLVMPDQSIKHVHVMARVVRGEQGEVELVGAVRDVTERKKIEEAMRTSELRMRLIVETIPGLVHTMTADGELEYLNQQVLDYFGRTREEMKSWATNDILHPDERALVGKHWLRSVETGEPFDHEHRVRRADGTFRWFHSRGYPLRDKDGRIIRWYNLLTDIDDRKRAEEALLARERELRLIAESIPGMIIVTSPEGDLEYATQRLLDFVGRQLADLQDLKWINVVHPEDVDFVVPQWLHAVRTGEPTEIVYRMRRADGAYRWFHCRLESLLGERGETLRWYGLLVDVDDRRKAEEALRSSHAELAHVSRLTTIGELTASIAHEVNQPLTAVINNANVCLSLLPNLDPSLKDVREALTDIVDDSNRASAVIARIRRLARKAPFERSILDLNDLVGDVLVLARHEFATRLVNVRTALPADPPWVAGDRVQLQQVLLNLIVNGMDAMTAVEDARRVLVIGVGREGAAEKANWVVGVQDAGVGFAREDEERLFQAFFTTKPQGMGMGLAISRSIVEAHGGRLWARPNDGPGATFLFSLPMAEAAAP